MNIEEERKAFEASQLKRHPSCDLRRWADAYRSNIVQAAWISWLDAKEHAEEISRPACYVRCSSADGKWWVDSAFFKTAFNTKSQAIFHARDNGYRVLSE